MAPISCPEQNEPKWIKECNVRPKALNLLKGIIEEVLHDIDMSNDFLDRILKHRKTAKFDKWNNIKLKNSCITMEIIKRVKRLAHQENACKSFISQKLNIATKRTPKA